MTGVNASIGDLISPKALAERLAFNIETVLRLVRR
jgi:DNA-binding CsgD family transcriptional regulator